MADNKTKPTDASVEAYFALIDDASRRQDCEALAALMARVTEQPPTMWGDRIVGFGSYHYRYASGHEGDTCVVGFMARKGDISLYGLKGDGSEELLSRLGKHKAGKGCVYVKRLNDVDLEVLEQLVVAAVAEHAS